MSTKAQQGIDQSSAASGEWWKVRAKAFIHGYLRDSKTMFVDDLWDAGLPVPTSKRALGHVIQWFARYGYIESQVTDNDEILARPSTASNGQLKRVWKSNLYVKP